MQLFFRSFPLVFTSFYAQLVDRAWWDADKYEVGPLPPSLRIDRGTTNLNCLRTVQTLDTTLDCVFYFGIQCSEVISRSLYHYIPHCHVEVRLKKIE